MNSLMKLSLGERRMFGGIRHRCTPPVFPVLVFLPNAKKIRITRR
jgi:hypothetical protein